MPTECLAHVGSSSALSRDSTADCAHREGKAEQRDRCPGAPGSLARTDLRVLGCVPLDLVLSPWF